MNDPLLYHSIGPVEDGLFDRLVDGTLSESERRGLLLRLDSEPDGWRRCALAFLQARAFEEAFSKEEVRFEKCDLPRSKRVLRPRAAFAACAAAVVFGIGLISGLNLRREPVTGLVSSGTNKSLEKPGDVAPSASPAPRVVQTVAYLELTTDGKQTARVPIYAGPGIDERWLRNQPPLLSERDRRRWKRLGYAVEEERRLLSVDLNDGRRVSVPVEDVRFKYVGKPTL